MKKHQGKRVRPYRQKPKFTTKPVKYLLERSTIHDMHVAKQYSDALVKYHWNYYSELAHQRNAIQDEIKEALIQTCIPYVFNKWQRALKYKYSWHPLSTVGSLTFIGGRFNTGAGVNIEVPVFPGLYLAEDKDTALQEHLGQEAIPKGSKLTAREIALNNPTSETIVSISGKMDQVFDLTVADNLKPFVELVKNFNLSNELKATASRLRVPAPGVIENATELSETLLRHDWRDLPSNYDVPSNSQIFGYLVHLSGIEGILYPSKLQVSYVLWCSQEILLGQILTFY